MQRAGGASVDLSIERAACALLLGRPEDAAATLGLTAGAAGAANTASGSGEGGRAAADAEVRAFVLSHSPDGEADLLPGIVALVTAWLQASGRACFGFSISAVHLGTGAVC